MLFVLVLACAPDTLFEACSEQLEQLCRCDLGTVCAEADIERVCSDIERNCKRDETCDEELMIDLALCQTEILAEECIGDQESQEQCH